MPTTPHKIRPVAAPIEDDRFPFPTVESAQEYIALLGGAIDESRRDIQEDIDAAGIDRAERRLEALHLVHYKLHQLQNHMNASGRLLNDLRTLRRLLLAERRGAAFEEEQVALPIRRK